MSIINIMESFQSQIVNDIIVNNIISILKNEFFYEKFKNYMR